VITRRRLRERRSPATPRLRAPCRFSVSQVLVPPNCDRHRRCDRLRALFKICSWPAFSIPAALCSHSGSRLSSEARPIDAMSLAETGLGVRSKNRIGELTKRCLTAAALTLLRNSLGPDLWLGSFPQACEVAPEHDCCTRYRFFGARPIQIESTALDANAGAMMERWSCNARSKRIPVRIAVRDAGRGREPSPP
jgi:hypothetical protein